MKLQNPALLAVAFGIFAGLAAATEAGHQPNAEIVRPWFISEVGRDHTRWSEVFAETNHAGRVSYHTNSYVEIETCRRYWDGSAWQETRAEIELTEDGAAALHGPHKVRFNANLNSTVPIEVATEDGKQLKFKILGLAYYDFHAEQYVFIAEVQDTIGQLVNANQVIYPDAFRTDGFQVDVRYTYRKAGIEQDIILRNVPPLPEDFGLDPITTRLLVVTELLMPSAEIKKVEQVRRGWKTAKIVKTVDFGAMKIGTGTAFSAGAAEDRRKGVPVNKLIEVIDGRTCLIEEISFPRLVSHLRDLQAAGTPKSKRKTRLASTVRESLKLPAIEESTPAFAGARFEVASAHAEAPGFVIDFNLESTSNMLLQGNTTYLVNGSVQLGGTTIIEGGTVIKYATNATLDIRGPVVCRTAVTRPAFFTALDDNTVGTPIQGSTGNPTNYYANCALALIASSEPLGLKHLRFRYALQAFYACNVDHTLSDSQFVSCFVGVMNVGCYFTNYNLLMHKVQLPYNINWSHGRVEHLTCNEAAVLVDDYDFGYLWWCATEPATASLTLVNSLTSSITNGYGIIPISTNHVRNFESGTGIFQTVGAGAHYLVNSSTNRDAGTAAISQGALASIRTGTTFPPVLLSNVTVTGQVDLRPEAMRDTDAPDLGYHYSPVDYLVTPLAATNATVRVHPGTVIARDYGVAGLWITGTSSIECLGLPTNKITFACYPIAQEQPWSLGPYSPQSGMHINSYRYGGVSGFGKFRFTEFVCLPGEMWSIYMGEQWAMTPLTLRDCSFYGGELRIHGSQPYQVVIHNNLFDRANLYTEDTPDIFTSNNLFRNCDVVMDSWSAQSYTFIDNAVHNCNAYVDTLWGNPVIRSNNAYINTVLYHQTNSTEMILTNFQYASGPLGDYYQASTNFLNMGSRSAPKAGLFHYTTTTNQFKEAETTVDIGMHYVAVDSTGGPLDTDDDGIPDYIEDIAGNGSVDSGETDWNSSTDLGLKVSITRPKSGLLP